MMTDVSKNAIMTAFIFFPFTMITYSWSKKNTKVAICRLFHSKIVFSRFTEIAHDKMNNGSVAMV